MAMANRNRSNSKRSANTKTAGSPRVDPRQRALTWLRDHGSPRLVMSLMLAATIGCGFITSITLHRIGLGSPIVRYPLAVLAGWAVFLTLVSVWVWWQRRENVRADERANVARSSASGSDSSSGWSGGVGPGGSSSSSASGGSSWSGGGGRFGGGGASDSFAEGPAEGPADGLASGFVSDGSSDSSAALSFDGGGGGSGGSGGSVGKGGDWSLDLDGDGDFVVLLVAIVVVAAAVFGVVFYAVYSAPTFFAELLIDGGVGTWLYKRADVANRPDWLATAVHRSVWPVVVLLVMFVALALTMRHVAPGATTLGQAWHVVLEK